MRYNLAVQIIRSIFAPINLLSDITMRTTFLTPLFFAFTLGTPALATPPLEMNMAESQTGNYWEKDFQTKLKAFPRGDFFKIFQTKMTTEEKDAMQFLYAYMSSGDLTDYPGDFYLRNVRSSLQTRKEATWGNKISDQLFRHFVLPLRINNENLDDARTVFHKELWPRVKGLSMYDAILEVNHWCHEKVVYTPSDARTSAPMATVKTAYGRCGEESTFLVAALRSVGIPARQVYTPRWAHTDDNHAWVEAWADGKWYFLGACEPEPVLNLGWFNAPASRGMLMHTKVFGHYTGPEEVMRRTRNYTEINVIGNYAAHAKATVKIVDAQGKPLSGVNVEFKIYNYAEYYTVSRQKTGADGTVSLSAGLGDMVVFASHEGKFILSKVSFGKDKLLVLTLDRPIGKNCAGDLTIVPPVGKPNIPKVTPEQRAKNTLRMDKEDNIRHAYVNTFPTEEWAAHFALSQQLDEKKTASFIVKSRGNYQEIIRFLQQAVSHKKGERALQLLGTLSDKDLRDTPCAVLEDHLYHTSAEADVKEVLAPRVAGEMLTPYRAYFQQTVSASQASLFKENPQRLVDWCKNQLKVEDDWNTVNTIESPEGVWKSRVTDKQSRNVFFVALCRSLGIRSWIDEVTGNLYYRTKGGEAVRVKFETEKPVKVEKGLLKATYTPIARLDNPKYYTHFTLSKYVDGTFQLLNYPEDATWKSLLENGTSLEAGYYLLTTGSRMADGSVLSHNSFFEVTPNKETTVELKMLDNTEGIRVIGNFNSESTYQDPQNKEEKSVLSTTGRGYFVIGVLGYGQEPTNHALKDIELKKKEFEQWGRPLLLLFTNEASYKKFNPKHFPKLPSTVTYGIDKDGKIQQQIAEAMKLADGGRLPVFIIGDTFNRVVFNSEGYTIGLGDQLLKVIHGLE